MYIKVRPEDWYDEHDYGSYDVYDDDGTKLKSCDTYPEAEKWMEDHKPYSYWDDYYSEDHP